MDRLAGKSDGDESPATAMMSFSEERRGKVQVKE